MFEKCSRADYREWMAKGPSVRGQGVRLGWPTEDFLAIWSNPLAGRCPITWSGVYGCEKFDLIY